jgi:hypothetical protein
MKQKQYTFPVIVSEKESGRLFGNAGIPQSWVVDRRGFRSERFNAWSLGRILTEIERLAESAPKQHH